MLRRDCVILLYSAQTIVVSSIFGELYSTNGGASFSQSLGGGTSQSVRYLGVNGDGGLKFGVTGQYGNAQGIYCAGFRFSTSLMLYNSCYVGVGISTDGGALFKTYNAGITCDARYGAFPSDTQWYVAAGDWPNNENKMSKSVFMRGDRHFPAAYSPRDVNGTFAFVGVVVSQVEVLF